MPEQDSTSPLPVALLLAGSGGMLDAFVYMNHGHVFANAMTGNVVLLGISVLSHDWIEVVRHLVPLCAFAAGVTVSNATGAQKKPRLRLAGLGVEILVLFAAGFLPLSFPQMAFTALIAFVASYQVSIRILAPIIGIKCKKDSEADKDITKQNRAVLCGFRSTYVFDVSQTEGAPLPELRGISGDVGENRDRLLAFIESRGIELVFTESIAPDLGRSSGGRIAILPGQSKAEEFATLVHEVAHEMLHKAERRTATTKRVRETEAEAIAFVIAKAVGLETGTASADYIQLYHGNASLLAESLEVVQHASAVILAALQPPTKEQEAMQDAELAQVA